MLKNRQRNLEQLAIRPDSNKIKHVKVKRVPFYNWLGRTRLGGYNANEKTMGILLREFGEMFPDAHCELVHENPFELLIATLLSAQCTDVLVNRVTADLFQKYKTPEDYLAVDIEELQTDIRSIGLYRNKAKNIQALSQMLIDQFDGEVPANRDVLMTFPGVGRKTANVVVSECIWNSCNCC